jgi:hypothetical protein
MLFVWIKPEKDEAMFFDYDSPASAFALSIPARLRVCALPDAGQNGPLDELRQEYNEHRHCDDRENAVGDAAEKPSLDPTQRISRFDLASER